MATTDIKTGDVMQKLDSQTGEWRDYYQARHAEDARCFINMIRWQPATYRMRPKSAD